MFKPSLFIIATIIALGSLVTEGSSPILIDTSGDGFSLTDASHGVDFDLNANGFDERVSWTSADSDDAFLALDRNGNGTIDNGTELFGNFTLQPSSPTPNGFLALAWFDDASQGGNSDRLISSADSVFLSLRLWIDTNHNGVSESSELHSLSSHGVEAIALDYREMNRFDRNGNEFRYRARVERSRGTRIGRWAWDVFLVSSP